ncbi:MAG: glycogen/starch synthase [Myxococcota bacterium]|nr:glycogen/starch synthase [Myxococcota bacterium]
MHIAIVTGELSPFIDTASGGHYVASLADAFVSLGHAVSTVIPFPSNADLSAYSFARRLSPIAVNIADDRVNVIRHDGRTPTGVAVHLLEIDGHLFSADDRPWTPYEVEVFCRAAVHLLGDLSEIPDACLSIDASAAHMPLLGLETDTFKKTAHIPVLYACSEDFSWISAIQEATHRIAIADPAVAVRAAADKKAPLYDMIASGNAIALKMPLHHPLTVENTDKASAKIAYQMSRGLPVRSDVPLIVFPKCDGPPLDAALQGVLRKDVQVIAPQGGTDIEALAERYGDRLLLVQASEIRNGSLRAADACVVGDDGELCRLALACGTLPIADTFAGAELVDLDPACESGSGIILDPFSEQGLSAAFSRLRTAFSRKKAFERVLARLPGFVATWPQIAGHYLALLDEARSANASSS